MSFEIRVIRTFPHVPPEDVEEFLPGLPNETYKEAQSLFGAPPVQEVLARALEIKVAERLGLDFSAATRDKSILSEAYLRGQVELLQSLLNISDADVRIA